MQNNIHTLRQQEWLDLKQVEREFPVSKRTIWTWISTGRLPAYKPFRKTLLKRSDLERLLTSNPVNADLEKLVNEVVAEVAGHAHGNE
jgi:excisionase family DNA binding protein